MADNGTLGSRNPFAIKPTTPTRAEDSSNREARPLVAPPTLVLGGGGGAQDTPRASGFVLKPSALSAQTSNLKVYTTPTRINFNGNRTTDKASSDDDSATATKDGDQKDKKAIGAEVASSEKGVSFLKSATPLLQDGKTAKDSNASDTKSEPVGLLKADAEVGDVVFGQNLDSRVTNAVLPNPVESSIPATVDKEGFVFGENLHERVRNADVSDTKQSSVSEELTFATAACEKEPTNGSDHGSGADGGPKTVEKRSLTETAEEHQQRLENEAKKGRLHEVEVVTGEEDESNVLQINCKLYIYEDAQYHERGCGVLRVNDKEISDDGCIQSRVVMRTQGSLRVVLNTSVWSGMKVEHPSAKSVRLTGQSPEGVIGVFLVQCTSPKDADQLFHALEWRVQALKRAQQLQEPQQAQQQAETKSKDTTAGEAQIVAEDSGDASREGHQDEEDEPEDEDPSVGNTNTTSTLASSSPSSNDPMKDAGSESLATDVESGAPAPSGNNNNTCPSNNPAPKIE